MYQQLNRFDLNLLTALDALLMDRNVTRAAERLFVTQQAMSASLRRLRDHFGDPLLTRVGREMMLTPLATALTIPVREALLKVENALGTTPVFDPKLSSRRFRIALSDYASLIILPRLLRQSSTDAPGMVFEVEAIDETTYARVEHGDVAFSITTHDWTRFGDHRPSAEIRVAPLFTDDFVCVVDKSHPVIGEGMTAELYGRLRHNVARFGTHTETIVEKAWRECGISPHVSAVAPGFVALFFMLPGTPLVGTAQRKLASTLGVTLGLRMLECPIPIDKLTENLVWHARDELDPAHAYVRELFKNIAKDL
jgi:LysR family transcriptional regulator, nod-box dependent transcriptional activator